MQTFLCFFDKLSALVIEILLLICTILGILMTFYGLSNIPFDIGKKGFQIFFEFNIIFISLALLIILIFILLRIINLINSKFNKICYYLSIGLISLSVLGFTINLINDTFILINLYYYSQKSKRKNLKQLTIKQWKDTILVFAVLFLIYFALIFLSLSDNLRVYLKIDDSYIRYQQAIEEDINNNENTIENIKRMNQMKSNNLNEKNGNNINKNIEVVNNEMNNIDNQLGSKNELDKNLNKNEENKN
jgi:hypothetical protein